MEYTGTVLTGVVGPEHEIGECRDSIELMRRRAGDDFPIFIRATKGYEARQILFNKFMASKHDFLLLLDHDMIFPPDTLDRLRLHKLPYVSGYYLRRRFAPIAPVWFEHNPRGQWPYTPYTTDPARGQLHKLGASGWGCVLVHRAVVEGVRAQLKGEPEVIEDDMDLEPYDLPAIMRAIHGLRALADAPINPINTPLALLRHVETLEREIKPLRGLKDPVGSDIRFPFYASRAGFQLWGDPDVRCGHVLNYPLSPDDYSGIPEQARHELQASIRRDVKKERARVAEALRGVNSSV